ncbi:MAG: 30S ribosomal protein S20 [Candidatus Kapaibacteriales bacterium]
MANHESAVKRIRQTRKRRYYNRVNKKEMKLALRSVRESGDYDSAMENFRKATSVVDRNAAKGIIHKNKAARIKSRLWNAVKAHKG